MRPVTGRRLKGYAMQAVGPCGPCCPGKRPVRTISVDGQQIGVSFLDEIIEKALDCCDAPEEEVRSVLLRELKAHNYVPLSIEREYLDAVWSEYLKELKKGNPKPRTPKVEESGTVKEVHRMAEESFGKIPRERIPWSPEILADKCTGCGACVSFCHKGVYEEGSDTPVVANPHRCVVGCTGCASQCPSEAIRFPTLVELREALARLRKEYGEQ